MEYILIALFGGGAADWQNIKKTNYDWVEIFERAKMDFEMKDVSINTLYHIILEIALDELAQEMSKYKGETSEDFKSCSKNICSYFEIWCNYWNTSFSFVGKKELGEEIQEKMTEKIEKINDKIGFTYISF